MDPVTVLIIIAVVTSPWWLMSVIGFVIGFIVGFIENLWYLALVVLSIFVFFVGISTLTHLLNMASK